MKKGKFTGKHINFSQYKVKLQQIISEGAFSDIYLTNDESFIAKSILLQDKFLQSYEKEIKMFRMTGDSEHVVKMYDVIEDGEYGFILLENCPTLQEGSVMNLLNQGPFNQQQIEKIFTDLLKALQFLHQVPIIHRDIKPENLLLSRDGTFKLCDFGSATQQVIQEITSQNRPQIEEDILQNTTPNFRAPEQLDLWSNQPITDKVDIWAAGIFLYLIVYGEHPFGENEKLNQISGKYKKQGQASNCQFIDIILPLVFSINPQDRPSAQELLSIVDKSGNTPLYPSIPVSMESSVPNYQKFSKEVKQKRVENQREEEEKSEIDRLQVTPYFQLNITQPDSFYTFKSIIDAVTWKGSTKSWVKTATEDYDEEPKAKYIAKLIIKAQQKTFKIPKFYNAIKGRLLNKTKICLKALIVMHQYLHKNQIIILQFEPSPFQILQETQIYWGNAQVLGSQRDPDRNAYFTGLILEYCQVLQRKLQIMDRYQNTMEPNYCLNPFFSNPRQQSLPFKKKLFEDIFVHWRNLIYLVEGIGKTQQLSNIRIHLAITVCNEIYDILRLTANLLKAQIYAQIYQTEYTAEDIDLNQSFEQFQELFKHSLIVFKKMKNVQIFPDISPEIPLIIQKILQKANKKLYRGNQNQASKARKVEIVQLLNCQKDIEGLSLPQSYLTSCFNEEFMLNLDTPQISEDEEEKESIKVLSEVKKEAKLEIARQGEVRSCQNDYDSQKKLVSISLPQDKGIDQQLKEFDLLDFNATQDQNQHSAQQAANKNQQHFQYQIDLLSS